jgi:hypothetical protein
MQKESFEHSLIKGRIAETIFEMMFRDTKKFTVLHLGYEYTTSILAQYRNMVVMQKVLDPVRKAPDFMLLTEDKTQAYLVEVKYRAFPDKKEIVEIARKIVKNYPTCHLFLISKKGFYFDPVHSIINKNGDMELLKFSWVTRRIQDKYKKPAEDYLWRHKD